MRVTAPTATVRCLLATALLLVVGCTPPTVREPASDATAPPPASRPSDPLPESPGPTQAVHGALVVWARGDLPEAFATAVSDLPHVVGAAHVRGATLGLFAARDAAGSIRESYGEGFRVPVEVVALDPATYVATLPADTSRDDARRLLGRLTPGRVLLTATGASLRGADVGWSLDIGGADGLVVAGVVPDGTAGRAEVVAHVDDADRLGLDEDGTVFLRHDASPGPVTARLIADIEDRVPDDLTARVVEVGVTGDRRRAPLVLSLVQVKARFGEFAFRPAGGRNIQLAPGFTDRHIVTVEVPLLGRVTCHQGIIEDLRDALNAIAEAGLSREIDPGGYAGCFNPRRISERSDRLSHHAWGIALDVNVDLSHPQGGEPPHPDVVAAFEAHGFRWGGDFIHPDNHHFEWIGANDG